MRSVSPLDALRDPINTQRTPIEPTRGAYVRGTAAHPRGGRRAHRRQRPDDLQLDRRRQGATVSHEGDEAEALYHSHGRRIAQVFNRLAGRVGFEPTWVFRPNSFSRRARSTAPSPPQVVGM